MTDAKPLPPAPADPYDDVRVLIDGDQCDARECPAIAFVRVYMYTLTEPKTFLSTLHFCSHHWHTVAAKFQALSLDGRCGIIDETTWLEAHT